MLNLHFKSFSVKIRVVAFILMLLPFFSLAQTEKKPQYAPGKEKHRNKTDEIDRKQGTWFFYNRFGEKMSEVDYVDDKKQGMERTFYAYGKVREEQEYVADIKDGTYTRYYY